MGRWADRSFQSECNRDILSMLGLFLGGVNSNMLRATLVIPVLCGIFCSGVRADDYATTKMFDRSPQEVFEAAQKATRHLGARIQETNSSSNTFTFSRSESRGLEQYSGFHATFIAEPKSRKSKGGQTIARLRITGIRWSNLARHHDTSIVGSTISREFFAQLRRELGLCKSCKSAIHTGGGLVRPRISPPRPRIPNY